MSDKDKSIGSNARSSKRSEKELETKGKDRPSLAKRKAPPQSSHKSSENAMEPAFFNNLEDK